MAAGFRPDELAELRRALDAAGAADLPLLPGTPSVLARRVSRLDATKEPAWSEALTPELSSLAAGNGPRAVLASGLDPAAQFQLWSLLQDAGMGRICLAMVGPDDAQARVATLLTRAIEVRKVARVLGAWAGPRAGTPVGTGRSWQPLARPRIQGLARACPCLQGTASTPSPLHTRGHPSPPLSLHRRAALRRRASLDTPSPQKNLLPRTSGRRRPSTGPRR